MSEIGEVAERSNATDCKSVAQAASEVRILPSPPRSAVGAVGQRCGRRMRGSNSVVESQPSKLLVAGSIPVSRSSTRATGCLVGASRPPDATAPDVLERADVAQW